MVILARCEVWHGWDRHCWGHVPPSHRCRGGPCHHCIWIVVIVWLSTVIAWPLLLLHPLLWSSLSPHRGGCHFVVIIIIIACDLWLLWARRGSHWPQQQQQWLKCPCGVAASGVVR